MTEVNRKIHIIGINSYKFEDLSFKLQNLFLETEINGELMNASSEFLRDLDFETWQLVAYKLSLIHI